jgi:hypothetical protein
MRTVHLAALALGATLALPAAPAAAGPIERACLDSGRAAASRALCSCIQGAANVVLNARDQRRAAEFFRDPQRAQAVRMSRSDEDNAFWARYREFGALAEQSCSRG